MNSANHGLRITLRDWVKFAIALAIPLTIGTSTIVISLHQQNVARATYNQDAAQRAELRRTDMERRWKQRQEDRETACLQRAEDKNLSRLQREEDRKLLDRQRDEDREAACTQLVEDRETAQLQRELDWQVAIDKHRQADELAEIQRKFYQSKRAHELTLAQEKYVSEAMLEADRQNEEILVEYQRELTALLGNLPTQLGKLDSKFVFVLQMRTRMTLGQLDATRRTILLKSLHQANLFRHAWQGELSILYQANVSGVQFNQLFDEFTTAFPDIEQADVRYASFRSVVLLSKPSFAYSNLDYTDWSFSEMNMTDMNPQMTMNNAIFTGSRWTGIAFERVPLNGASFQRNEYCSRCMFLETSLSGARFDQSTFSESTFGTISMADANLTNASFVDSEFHSVILDRVNANGADFRRCSFHRVSMMNCSMFDVKLGGSSFRNVNMTGCVGIEIDEMKPRPTLINVILPNGTLVLY